MMDKSGVGFLAGVFLAVLIVLVIFMISASRGKAKMKSFDEMQHIIRGKAYRNAFFVVIGLLAFTIFLSAIVDIYQIIDSPSVLCIVLMAGVVTFAVQCILNDAFFGLEDACKGYMALIIAIGAINLLLGVLRIIDGSLWVNGVFKFTKGGSNLIMASSFAIVLVALLIKRARGKNEVAE